MHVLPTQVSSVENDASIQIHVSRAADADARDVVVFELRLFEGIADGLDNPLHPDFRPFQPFRLAALAAESTELLIEDGGHHFGAAEIEADPVLFPG